MTTVSDFSKCLVSIVVPVYNAESYLHRFLVSIQDQLHRNLEVILVDDGSTDSSLDVCRWFALNDKRFVVKTKENAGVASARSVGNKLATGDFIIHFDPDDVVPRAAIYNMLKKLVADSSDICIGGYLVRFPRAEIPKKINEIYDSAAMLRALAAGDTHGALWNKLIKRELVKDIDFCPGINFMEDKIFLIKVLINNPGVKFSYLDEVVYCYYQRAGSYTNSSGSLERFKESSEIVFKLLSGVASPSELSLIRNRIRLVAILDSADPFLEYRQSDFGIVEDKGIAWCYRMAVFFMSKRCALPFRIIRTVRASRRRYLGLFP